jgi:hypothetical protein
MRLHSQLWLLHKSSLYYSGSIPRRNCRYACLLLVALCCRLTDRIIAARNDINFQYKQGTNILTPVSPTSISNAASTAAAADLTILVLGLSSLVERESLDRINLTLPEVQQQLFAAVAAVVPPSKLLLITVSANGIDYDTTLASTALQAWYGGEGKHIFPSLLHNQQYAR